MKLKFSKIEIKELFIATIMLSIAFSILFVGLSFNILLIFPLMFLVMVFSFIIHEMAHKYMAQKYKYQAEFRANKGMLWITIALSIFGFIIATPGAVHFFGQEHDIKKIGIIAYAGPFANIIAAIIFFGLTFVTNFGMIYYLYFINAALGVFNLIPFRQFDGWKVMQWNKAIYIVTVVFALFLWSVPMMIG